MLTCLCRNTQSKWDGSKRWLLADGLGSVFKMVCVSHVWREFGLVRVPYWALPCSCPSPRNRRRRREKPFLLRRESVEQARLSVLSGRAFHSPWGSLAFPTSTLLPWEYRLCQWAGASHPGRGFSWNSALGQASLRISLRDSWWARHVPQRWDFTPLQWNDLDCMFFFQVFIACAVQDTAGLGLKWGDQSSDLAQGPWWQFFCLLTFCLLPAWGLFSQQKLSPTLLPSRCYISSKRGLHA